MDEIFGFLITAYKQKDLCEKNIENIKEMFQENCKIVIVSTSEDDIVFKELEKYENVSVIEFKDAPPYEGDFCSLTKRILLSIEIGLKKLTELNVDYCLHLHSDTFWDANKKNILVDTFNDLIINDYLIIGDIDVLCDCVMAIPQNTHFHPEGLFINIKYSNEIGYSYFSNIFNDSGFLSHNFCSIEALISQYAIYCLSGENILTVNTYIPIIYFEKVKINLRRGYHGVFESGLINYLTIQR